MMVLLSFLSLRLDQRVPGKPGTDKGVVKMANDCTKSQTQQQHITSQFMGFLE